jgi:hypothetical protein
LLRQKPLSFATEVAELQTLDQSTALFFTDLKYMGVMMTASFLVYGLFAVVTNILAGRLRTTQIPGYLNQISLGSKINNMTEHNQHLYVIQVWVGLLMVLVWVAFFLHKEIRRREM